MKTVLAAMFLLFMTLTSDAYAYLDPGTGSYVLQIVIAGIVSTFFTLKIFWRKIVDFFSGLFRGKK